MRFYLLWLIVFSSRFVMAQHCPFDGHSTVVIKVTGALPHVPMPVFKLTEVAGPFADSCAFVPGKIEYQFKTGSGFYQEMAADSNGVFNRFMLSKLVGAEDFVSGNQLVFLSQAAATCMVERGNGYNYIPRVFQITYTYKETQYTVPVDAEKLYALCTSRGRWGRISPVLIQLK